MSASAISISEPRDAAATLARVGVIVVTYRSAPTIAGALGALDIASLAGVVVVDNASDDETVALVRSHRGVDTIANASNVGFGAGCNAGVTRLGEGAEFVLFLNPDASISAPDLITLVAYLDDHPSCAVAGPRLYRGDEPLTSAGRTATALTELRLVAPARIARRIAPRRFDPAYNDAGPVGYVEGACFLTRREALARVGGFDERYFLFYEELDLARRLAVAGWSVDLCPHASATHLVARSRDTLSDRGKAHLIQSARTYLRTWHGRTAASAFGLSHAVTRHRRIR